MKAVGRPFVLGAPARPVIHQDILETLMRSKFMQFSLAMAFAMAWMAPTLAAQNTGTLRGTVTLENKNIPLHGATVRIAQLGRTTQTDDSGGYQFENVPAGTYDVVVHAHAVSDDRKSVSVTAGAATTQDFLLKIAPIREQITVTASGREETAFEAFQTVTSLDAIEISQDARTSLGEVLEHKPGVAKRSFGPGSARPVLRGFDGDRVLVMKDGISTGTLSSQSGDHGESADVLTLERVEVVKGPATLLYGSSAIGGVVNMVTPQDHLDPHLNAGLTGYATGVAGSNNAHGGGGAGFEYGTGRWMLSGSGSGQRTGDYNTPIGEIRNSKTRIANGGGGVGWYGDRGFLHFNGGYENSRYGIPFAGEFEEPDPLDPDPPQVDIDIAMRRAYGRLTTGARNLEGFLDNFVATLDFSHYTHSELEIEDGGPEEIGTVFQNRLLTWRGVFQQRKRGLLSGSFGFSGSFRNYDVTGAEALSPPVDQNNFAVFGLQELGFEHFRLQFGGRVETNKYTPAHTRPVRDFTGFSGAAGIRVPTWKGGAFVVNYTHAYRAPALEELYNEGPHIGNLAFELGNPDLKREMSDGVEMSVRHRTDRVRGEATFFYYRLSDFIFLVPTGGFEDGLIEAEYLQGNSRFVGSEASLDVSLHPHVWLNLGLDVVDAQLTNAVTSPNTGVTVAGGTGLPRIPPVRGRVGLDLRYKGLSVRPEAIMASHQDDVFPTETPTAGYATFNLGASYTVPTAHLTHVVSVNAFNLGDRLYRNHLSFIKQLMPEMGRGVRVSYTVRFF
jgi:iron complex outermembrane recepter protein